MKKLSILLVTILLVTTTTKAQFEIENLFGGGNLAYAVPTSDFSEYAKGGIAYNTVIGYDITEKVAVGIEYGGALTAGFDETISTGLFGINLYGLSNYMIKGWYKFSENKVKPYTALGLGLSNVAEPDITIQGQTIEGAGRLGFGANAELGVSLAGFNISYSFNIAGRTPKEEDAIFNPIASDLPVNYHRIGIGYIYSF